MNHIGFLTFFCTLPASFGASYWEYKGLQGTPEV